jgi:hypothetical protein
MSFIEKSQGIKLQALHVEAMKEYAVPVSRKLPHKLYTVMKLASFLKMAKTCRSSN